MRLTPTSCVLSAHLCSHCVIQLHVKQMPSNGRPPPEEQPSEKSTPMPATATPGGGINGSGDGAEGDCDPLVVASARDCGEEERRGEGDLEDLIDDIG